MEEIIKGLNPQQLKAVTTTEGYVRIIAGAGSGKTKALTHRYAFIVKTLGVPSENILCVTFTNKAANEMKKRIYNLIGDGYDSSLITTYHGFCVRVLRESISKLFYPENFIILDIQDQKKILEEIYDKLDIKLDHSSFEKILKKIEIKKATPEYVNLMTDPSFIIDSNNCTDLDDKILKMYLQRQKKVFGLDFNDLINFTFVLFDKFSDVLNMWQKRLNYIQVDEFQDSSNRELKLINMLSKVNKNLFVVGDPDQNIYEWRGAKVEILVNFDKQHEGTNTIIMNQNYRSTPQILAVSNSLIEKNAMRIKKDLFTENSDGSRVILNHTKTEVEEALWICEKIKSLKNKENYSYNDIVILYRANYLSRFIENALFTENIPYKIWGGVRFFDRMEIKDALSYLRMIAYNDDISLSRIINVPKRRFGKSNMIKLREYADLNNLSLYDALKASFGEGNFTNTAAGSFIDTIEHFRDNYIKIKISELFHEVLEYSGYEKYIRENGDMERLENLAELKKNITEFERAYGNDASVEMYLRQVSLQNDSDNEDNTESVKLMTIHSSKGLEFPAVFICGLTDGIFPSSRSVEERKQAGLEEERRLFFVGITRAKKKLFLSESEGFNNSGARKIPSRFIFNISEELFDKLGKIPKDLYNQAISKASGFLNNTAVEKLAAGNNVIHPLFGPGIVESIDDKKQVYIIYFEKLKQTRPIMMNYNWKAFSELNINLIEIKEKEKENTAQTNMTKNSLPITKFETSEIPSDNEEEKIVEKVLDEAMFNETPLLNEEVLNEEQDYITITDDDEKIDRLFINEEEKIIESEILNNTDEVNDEQKIFENSDDTNIDEIKVIENSVELQTEEKNIEIKPNKKNIIRNEDSENHWKDPNFPKTNWVCTDVIDLGQPVGVCGMCNYQIIRYVHKMQHPSGLRLGVGCVCAGKMEGNENAAILRENDFKKKQSRKINFLKHDWKKSSKNNFYIKYKQKIIVIYPDQFKKNCWVVVCEKIFIKGITDFQKAKEAGFDLVEGIK